jgi:hypothetical protein
MASVDIEPAIGLWEIRDDRYATDDPPGAAEGSVPRMVRFDGATGARSSILESDRPGAHGAHDGFGDRRRVGWGPRA